MKTRFIHAVLTLSVLVGLLLVPVVAFAHHNTITQNASCDGYLLKADYIGGGSQRWIRAAVTLTVDGVVENISYLTPDGVESPGFNIFTRSGSGAHEVHAAGTVKLYDTQQDYDLNLNPSDTDVFNLDFVPDCASATNTPTNTPSSTPDDTTTATPTNTVDPEETPADTPTPSDTPAPTGTFTPTFTAEPPELVDPKVASLVEDNDGNGVVSPGDVLEYVITISNIGRTTVENVTFSDTPDPHTFLVVGTVTTTHGVVAVGNTAGDTTILVDVGELTAGDTVTITFDILLDPDLPANAIAVCNQGLVSGENFGEQPTDDPDTNDPDDPTCTRIDHPEPTPTNPPSDPGDPGDPGNPSDPVDPGDSGDPAPPTTAGLLIPVTGVDLTGGGLTAGLVFHLGLAMLGLALVLHAWSFRANDRADEPR